MVANDMPVSKHIVTIETEDVVTYSYIDCVHAFSQDHERFHLSKISQSNRFLECTAKMCIMVGTF